MEAKYRQLFGPVLLVGSLGELENLSSRYERSLGSSIQWWVYTFPLDRLESRTVRFENLVLGQLSNTSDLFRLDSYCQLRLSCLYA